MNTGRFISILLTAWSLSVFLYAGEPELSEQEYHLVYIELSDNNNRMGLVEELNRLFNTFNASGDPFVSYVSNAQNGLFFESTHRVEELFYLIRDLNISLPDVDQDLREITGYWNKHDISRLDEEGFTRLLYEGVNIHYFVSPSFYDLTGGYFASKLLGVNNINEINGNAGRVRQFFYFNANDADEEFMAYIRRNFSQGLERSVTREFITY